MEMKFNKTACPCLQTVVCQIQTQEQTQEVRLPDAMPDIGRVLGCWGQALIRSKEWRGNTMSVSGGIMAWVLYAPEGEGGPKSIDIWIPFQIRWDLPQTQRDGAIVVTPLVKSMDARSTSARKLMVRANVSILGKAMEPVEKEICDAPEMPGDIQLLRASYPMDLPKEAGEKLFQVDEELTILSNQGALDAILRWDVTPCVLEQKVMAGRLVFRGKCDIHLLYSDGEGNIHSFDTEVPFSQYAELDQDFSPNGMARTNLIVTGMELNPGEEGKLWLKCGLAAQYTVFDRVMVQTVEDAYSPLRSIQMETEELELPVLLDSVEEDAQMQANGELDAQQIYDISFLTEHPVYSTNEQNVEFSGQGQFQVLYGDKEGNLQSATYRAEGNCSVPSDPENRMEMYISCRSRPQCSITPQGITLSCDCRMGADVYSNKAFPMVSAIAPGDAVQPDPGRPSVILRRAGEDRLWDIAKACGSTVDAICKANDIAQEPEPGCLLLIPVT